jgi:proliferating cell nuclear antigen PCNA
MSTNILEVMTAHTTPFKILIEVLKEILQEINIEFTNVPKKSDDPDNNNTNNNTGEDTKLEKDDGSTVKNDNGMRILAVDTTKTVLINMKLEAKNFSNFKCVKNKLVIGVNLAYFYKLIKSMDKDDNLTLLMDSNEQNYLKIKIENPDVGKDTVSKLKLMDLTNPSIKIPNISFDAKIIMNSNEFHKICRDMHNIAEYVEIQCLKNKIIFTCKGDYGERTTTYRSGENDDGDGVTIRHTDTNKAPIIQGIYELKNLVLFSKCASLCNDIEIYMKNSFPLAIRYTVATLGKILLCLTPINDDRINNNYNDDDNLYEDEEVKVII